MCSQDRPKSAYREQQRTFVGCAEISRLAPEARVLHTQGPAFPSAVQLIQPMAALNSNAHSAGSCPAVSSWNLMSGVIPYSENSCDSQTAETYTETLGPPA